MTTSARKLDSLTVIVTIMDCVSELTIEPSALNQCVQKTRRLYFIVADLVEDRRDVEFSQNNFFELIWHCIHAHLLQMKLKTEQQIIEVCESTRALMI